MNAERLAGIKERSDKATEGPWFWDACDDIMKSVKTDDNVISGGACQNYGYINMEEADIVFVANARQDVPELVAEVERLQAQEHFAEYAIKQNKALWEALSKACESLSADPLDYYEEEGGV